jgi:UDP-galactopyranose mutase
MQCFFKGYTKKQWNLDLSDLSAGVASRIPTRKNMDDRYFTDKFQYMPKNGYSKLFENLLDHKNISIDLKVDFFKNKNKYEYNKLIYTGPIDRFFDYQFGKLPYRSLKFKHEHFKKNLFSKLLRLIIQIFINLQGLLSSKKLLVSLQVEHQL